MTSDSRIEPFEASGFLLYALYKNALTILFTQSHRCPGFRQACPGNDERLDSRVASSFEHLVHVI